MLYFILQIMNDLRIHSESESDQVYTIYWKYRKNGNEDINDWSS